MDDHDLMAERVEQYAKNGYFTVEGLLAGAEVEAVHEETARIVARYPDCPEELVQMEPSVRNGENRPEDVELGVRKLFRMAKHNEFFRNLAFHPKMVEIANQLLGADITLVQSMLLMKPPHFGGTKKWHQDNAYFRFTPNHLFGFWIACDEARIENGCMHLVSGSHTNGIVEHTSGGDDYHLVNPPAEEEVVPIPLGPGDALVFHGDMLHYTPRNQTGDRRRALQYHYGSSKCGRTREWNLFKLEPEFAVAGPEHQSRQGGS